MDLLNKCEQEGCSVCLNARGIWNWKLYCNKMLQDFIKMWNELRLLHSFGIAGLVQTNCHPANSYKITFEFMKCVNYISFLSVFFLWICDQTIFTLNLKTTLFGLIIANLRSYDSKFLANWRTKCFFNSKRKRFESWQHMMWNHAYLGLSGGPFAPYSTKPGRHWTLKKSPGS